MPVKKEVHWPSIKTAKTPTTQSCLGNQELVVISNIGKWLYSGNYEHDGGVLQQADGELQLHPAAKFGDYTNSGTILLKEFTGLA